MAAVNCEGETGDAVFGADVARLLAAVYRLREAAVELAAAGQDELAAGVENIMREAWRVAGDEALGTDDGDDAPAADPEPAPELAGV